LKMWRALYHREGRRRKADAFMRAEIRSGGDKSGKADRGGRDAAFWPFTLVLMISAR